MALLHNQAILQTDDWVTKRMLWSDESMQVVVNSNLHENRGSRELAGLYNIPVETIRRHVNGSVPDQGQQPYLWYLVKMSDISYGMTEE